MCGSCEGNSRLPTRLRMPFSRMAKERRQILDSFFALTFEARVAVVLFLLVGCGAIVYGFRGLAFQLDRPFFSQLASSGKPYLSLDEQAIRAVEQQKKQDTDADGINDYDEIEIYHTSPYLIDSDSDGVSDAEEIRSGKNPACPEGQRCDQSWLSVDGVGDTAIDVGAAPTIDFGFSDGGLQTTNDLEQQIQKTPVGQLREVLLSTGIDPLLVERMDDDQVRALFNTAVQDAKNNGVIDQLLETQAEAKASLDASASETPSN